MHTAILALSLLTILGPHPPAPTTRRPDMTVDGSG